MKIESAVRAETGKIAVGTGALALLMVAVFLIIGKFDYTVLLGAVLGCGAAIGNFFLMALSVQKAANSMPKLPVKEETDEESDQDAPLSDEAKQAGRRVQLFYGLRMLGLGAVSIGAVLLPAVHSVAFLVPLLFPRIVISIVGILQNKEAKSQ